MNDREFEALLSRRLHDRFDAVQAPDRLRDAVVEAMSSRGTGAGSPNRSVLLALPRQLFGVAAVVGFAVIIVLAGHVGPNGGRSASPAPAPTGTTSAVPTVGATAVPSATPGPTAPTATVPPVSTTGWTGLDVHALEGAPQISTVVSWSGGYIAVGQAGASAPVRAWTSVDARTWAAISDQTFGVNDTATSVIVVGGTACGTGVLIATEDLSGVGTLWSSKDGVTWSSGPIPGGGMVASMAGGPAGAVVVKDGGSTIEFTKDCAAWQAVALPGPASTQIRALAAFGDTYEAVGLAGQGTATEPLAWWSTDGRRWSAATVERKLGDGFAQLQVGRMGLVAMSHGGAIPGTTSFWTSNDGRNWVISRADPFGTVVQGQGVGSAAGAFMGDGNRLIGFGTSGQGAGPMEYWLSADGKRWTKLALTGTAPDSSASYFRVFLVRDGVIFSGASGTWFGDPVAR